MKKKAQKKQKESGIAKGSDRITVLDLIVTLENVEAWTRVVRHVLELMPPKQELPALAIRPPMPPTRWMCLRQAEDVSWSGTGPSWHCAAPLDEASGKVRRSAAKDAGKPVPKKGSKPTKR